MQIGIILFNGKGYYSNSVSLWLTGLRIKVIGHHLKCPVRKHILQFYNTVYLLISTTWTIIFYIMI